MAEQGEELADLVIFLGGVPHRAVVVDDVAVASAVARTAYVARLDEVGHDGCAARSVMPTLPAMSRSRTSSCRAMQSRTCVWLVTKRQGLPLAGSLDIDALCVVCFLSS